MPPKTSIHYRQAVLAAALFLFAACAGAAGDKPVPRLEGRVTDVAKVLSEADRKRLAGMLTSYERETSHQIAVLLVPNLSGENIESFSLRVVNAWKLGQRGLDNGILVTLAMEEKLIRIELGAGMKKYISNAAAQSIIHDSMLPAFRKNDFAGGLHAGLQELMKQARKFVVSPAERKPAQKK